MLKSRKVPRRDEALPQYEEKPKSSTTLADLEDRIKGRRSIRRQLKRGNRQRGSLMETLRRFNSELNKMTSKMPSDKDIHKWLWR